MVHSNNLEIWHGFPDITHIKVNNGHKGKGISLTEMAHFVL